MRITNRAVLSGAILVLVLLVGLWVWAEHAQAPALIQPSTTEQVATSTGAVPTTETTQTAPALAVAQKVAETPEPPKPLPTATLTVNGATYGLVAPAGSTLEAAMQQLESDSKFSYESRTYTGLGSLVTSINGQASTGDLVWILYINGAKSTAGISSTRIRSGDIFKWNLEKSY